MVFKRVGPYKATSRPDGGRQLSRTRRYQHEHRAFRRLFQQLEKRVCTVPVHKVHRVYDHNPPAATPRLGRHEACNLAYLINLYLTRLVVFFLRPHEHHIRMGATDYEIGPRITGVEREAARLRSPFTEHPGRPHAGHDGFPDSTWSCQQPPMRNTSAGKRLCQRLGKDFMTENRRIGDEGNGIIHPATPLESTRRQRHPRANRRFDVRGYVINVSAGVNHNKSLVVAGCQGKEPVPNLPVKIQSLAFETVFGCCPAVRTAKPFIHVHIQKDGQVRDQITTSKAVQRLNIRLGNTADQPLIDTGRVIEPIT